MPKQYFNKPTSPQQEEERSESEIIQSLRGMKDILPENQPYWDFVKSEFDRLAQDYSYLKIDTPILEETRLFTRAVGEYTDVVEKEMFTFLDKGGESVALRPENTAGIVRAYIEHGMLNLPQPVQLCYWGPFFRYDRPQAGRFRQFHQFGFETIGDANSIIDAQMIVMTAGFFRGLGILVSFEVNSVGCRACRREYEQLLVDYLSSKRKLLCLDCKKRLVKNILRILDCKETTCRELFVDAPQIVDYLDEGCKNHLMKVLEYLDAAEVVYHLNSRLVRGLDYYTRTTFEIKVDGKEEDSSLGGGGRYDQLVVSLGGRPTPACGFACGIERIIAYLKERNIVLPTDTNPDVFVAQLGENAKKKSLKLIEDLRSRGFRVTNQISKDSLKIQLGFASKVGAKFSVILGQKEILDKTILIRDMKDSSQEVVDFEKIHDVLKKRLEKTNLGVITPNHTSNFSRTIPHP